MVESFWSNRGVLLSSRNDSHFEDASANHALACWLYDYDGNCGYSKLKLSELAHTLVVRLRE